MRIALFTDTYFPSVDGVVRSVSQLKRELTKLGHECLVIAPTVSKQLKLEKIQDDVVYCKAIRLKLYPEYSVPIYPSEVSRALKEIGVEIIHSHALAFMALRALRAHYKFDVPLVTTYHTRIAEAAKYYRLPFSRALRRLTFIYLSIILRRSDRVTVPSELARRELSGLGVDPIIIPNGVDLDRFRPTEEDRLGLREIDGFKVLFVGRLAYEKNLDLLVESAKILEETDCHFIIGGRGPARWYMEEKVKRMGLDEKFTFLGYVDEDDIPSLYSSCDLFATPSLFENMSMVMLEALACGLPVIAPEGTCFEEYLPKECLFRPDPAGMAERILSFKDGGRMDDPRKIAEKFSTQRCAERTLELYSECLNEEEEG
jgi:1,2-diacylglycerol 3-alpha-glucosyltransferase